MLATEQVQQPVNLPVACLCYIERILEAHLFCVLLVASIALAHGSQRAQLMLDPRTVHAGRHIGRHPRLSRAAMPPNILCVVLPHP